MKVNGEFHASATLSPVKKIRYQFKKRMFVCTRVGVVIPLEWQHLEVWNGEVLKYTQNFGRRSFGKNSGSNIGNDMENNIRTNLLERLSVRVGSGWNGSGYGQCLACVQHL